MPRRKGRALQTLIVVPVLNEAANVSRVISELLFDTMDLDVSLVVVDGGSIDTSAHQVARLAAGDPRIRLLHNERRLQGAGINLAVAGADPGVELIVRADCHASYPPGWVRGLITRYRERRRQGCVSIVVPMTTVGTSPVQRAIACAQNSVIGNGGSAHRIGIGSARYVDHGHHAALARDAFDRLGGYAEDMRANEDAEYDTRLVASGGRIFLDEALRIQYFPRGSLRALARQYYYYGRGRAVTSVRHQLPPKPRQLAPLVVTVVTATATATTMVDRRAIAVLAPYVAVCLGYGGAQAVRHGDPALLLAGPAAIVSHHAWGLGYLAQLGRKGGFTSRSRRAARTSAHKPMSKPSPAACR